MLATNCLKLFALKLKIKVNTCQTKDEKKNKKTILTIKQDFVTNVMNLLSVVMMIMTCI